MLVIFLKLMYRQQKCWNLFLEVINQEKPCTLTYMNKQYTLKTQKTCKSLTSAGVPTKAPAMPATIPRPALTMKLGGSPLGLPRKVSLHTLWLLSNTWIFRKASNCTIKYSKLQYFPKEHHTVGSIVSISVRGPDEILKELEQIFTEMCPFTLP